MADTNVTGRRLEILPNPFEAMRIDYVYAQTTGDKEAAERLWREMDSSSRDRFEAAKLGLDDYQGQHITVAGGGTGRDLAEAVARKIAESTGKDFYKNDFYKSAMPDHENILGPDFNVREAIDAKYIEAYFAMQLVGERDEAALPYNRLSPDARAKLELTGLDLDNYAANGNTVNLPSGGTARELALKANMENIKDVARTYADLFFGGNDFYEAIRADEGVGLGEDFDLDAAMAERATNMYELMGMDMLEPEPLPEPEPEPMPDDLVPIPDEPLPLGDEPDFGRDESFTFGYSEPDMPSASDGAALNERPSFGTDMAKYMYAQLMGNEDDASKFWKRLDSETKDSFEAAKLGVDNWEGHRYTIASESAWQAKAEVDKIVTKAIDAVMEGRGDWVSTLGGAAEDGAVLDLNWIDDRSDATRESFSSIAKVDERTYIKSPYAAEHGDHEQAISMEDDHNDNFDFDVGMI